MANNKWLVVQNHEGQQFPIAMDAVNQFLIRWPTKFQQLTPEYRVEAIGFAAGNNTVRTDHVDVFAGGDRSLVGPTYVQLQPGTRPPTAIAIIRRGCRPIDRQDRAEGFETRGGCKKRGGRRMRSPGFLRRRGSAILPAKAW